MNNNDQNKQIDTMYDITNLMTAAQIDSGMQPTFSEAASLVIIQRLDKLIDILSIIAK